MTIRLLMIPATLLLAATLSAQVNLNFSGTVADDKGDSLLIEIDFGSTPVSATLNLSASAISGSSGLFTSLTDLDRTAASGSAGGFEEGSHSGTGTINLSMTTPSYAGIQQFIVRVTTNSQNGPSAYSGSISSTGLAAGAITLAGKQTNSRAVQPGKINYYTLFDRGALYVILNQASGTFTKDLSVDFGTSPQSVTFWLSGGGTASGSIAVYEIDDNGMEQLLGTVSGSGTWSSETNPTTSQRDGVVKLRFKINASTAGLYVWQAITPSTVSVKQERRGGGGSDESCSTSTRPGKGALVLLLLCGALLGARVVTRVEPDYTA